MTYKQIAALLGISKQRVMQIEAGAFRKLRFRLQSVRKEITT